MPIIDAFQGMAALGAIAMSIFCLRFLKVGLPDAPVLLPGDEAAVCDPFGCKDFDELMYVMHINDRRELLQLLASQSIEEQHNLILRIDVERISNKRMECNNDPQEMEKPSAASCHTANN